jgi:hypothetical protein
MNDRALGEALSMPMAVGAVVANGPPILALPVPPLIRHSDELSCGAGAIGARRLSASRGPEAHPSSQRCQNRCWDSDGFFVGGGRLPDCGRTWAFSWGYVPCGTERRSRLAFGATPPQKCQTGHPGTHAEIVTVTYRTARQRLSVHTSHIQVPLSTRRPPPRSTG